MNNRILNVLLPAIGTVLIPQLLYFWIAPSAPCRVTVYLFGTLLTIANAALCVWCYSRVGLRRASGIIALSGSLTLAALVVCSVLLTLDASMRTAIFVLGIAAVLCIVSMVPMIGTVEPDDHVTPEPELVPSDLDDYDDSILPHPQVPQRNASTLHKSTPLRRAFIEQRPTPPPMPTSNVPAPPPLPKR